MQQSIGKFIKRYWLLIISIIYLIWPLDLITDLFGPIGLIDDGGLLIAAIAREIYLSYKDHQEKLKQEKLLQEQSQLEQKSETSLPENPEKTA